MGRQRILYTLALSFVLGATTNAFGQGPTFSYVDSASNGEPALPVSDYTAIFGGPVGSTPPNAVAAGGTGSD